MSQQTRDGGKPIVHPLPYDPPKPNNSAGQERKPGLGGSNHGTCGTQGQR